MDDIFTCPAAAAAPGAAVYLLTLALSCAGLWAAAGALREVFKPRGGGREIPEIYSENISNLAYLQECVRLSELRISDLIAAIQSYERRALAIIAGASALVAFIATKDWCAGFATYLGIGVLALSVSAVLAAGLIIATSANFGLRGDAPELTVGYYINDLAAVRAVLAEAGEDDETIETQERCYLLLLLLSKYERAIAATRFSHSLKSRKFTVAAYFMLMAFAGAVYWLAIKIWFFLA